MALHPADFAFGVALAFLMGVFVANIHARIGPAIFVLIGGGVALSFLKRKIYLEILLFPLVFLFGILYFTEYYQWQNAHVRLPNEKNIAFEAIVSDEPQPSEKFLMFPAMLARPFSGTIEVFAATDTVVSYGDLISLKGIVQPSDSNGDLPTLFLPSIALSEHHRGFFPRELMIDLKLAILKKFKDALPADQAALLGGIAFGSKVSFKDEFKKEMALSGTTHLVAVSGYNITIVILAAGSTFGRFFSRRITFFLSVLLLIAFMLMVGGAASGVRAAIMGFLALTARELGEGFGMRNAITFTALIMVMLEPTALTQNMSFILSFLSLLGIVYLQPILKIRFKQTEEGLFDWKENALTTISAQLAVIPVLIGVFGQFSITAIVANLLILSTVPLTMFLGLLLAAMSFVSYHLAFFVGKLTGLFLQYQIAMIQLFAKLAIPLPLPINSLFVGAFYYAILLIIIISHGSAKKI